jgi:type I restriction enzyme, S subunit
VTEVRALRAYAEVALGRQRSPDNATGPFMVPYLRAANVNDGALDLDDVKEMNFSPNEQAVFSLKRGDVLVTEGSGSLRAVGASAVWNEEIPGTVCFQNTLLRLRPRANTDPRYLAWWCRYAFADGLFASVATGANIFHVSAERVRSLPMTYLAPPVQRSIADYLDRETQRIDRLMTAQHRLVHALNERIDALIKERIGATPLAGRSSTPIAPLKRLVRKVHRPYAEGSPVVTAYRDGEVNARVNRREEGYTLAASEANYQGVREGDVVVHGLDGFSGAIGTARVSGSCSPVYHVCEPLGSNDGRYVARLLRVLALDGYLGAHATSVRERAVDLRNWELLGAIPVPVAPPEEQRLVARLIEKSVPIADATARISARLEERRQAVITAAVGGQSPVAEAA